MSYGILKIREEEIYFIDACLKFKVPNVHEIDVNFKVGRLRGSKVYRILNYLSYKKH